MKKLNGVVQKVLKCLNAVCIILCLLSSSLVASALSAPPCAKFDSYEQFALSISSGSFFNDTGFGMSVNESVKELMLKTNVIRMKINGECPAFDSGKYSDGTSYTQKLNVYYPVWDYQGYYARHNYNGEPVFYQVWYATNDTKKLKTNYDAVINGEKVRIQYSREGDGRYYGAFLYRDMYLVQILAYSQEMFKTIFENLTIEEININNPLQTRVRSTLIDGQEQEDTWQISPWWYVASALVICALGTAVLLIVVLNKRKEKSN